MQRCALGYDNANPLCATCVADYILVQGQKSYPCPGAYNNGAEELSIELVFAFGTGWFIGFIIFVLYFFSPSKLLIVLFCSRSKLYTNKNMKIRISSFYLHYKHTAYYFDVLDLARRLLLTGGLIMMGGESVAQIFLGIVVCANLGDCARL